ncbi:MAG: hypothetical protein ACHBN1_38295 [Heteroscytonema crispum UTEX LB 1556]
MQDATKFGLQGYPIGGEVFSGSGEDKLFGTSTATATFDFINRTLTGSGIITITGGAGRFRGAISTLNFTEIESLDQDPNAPLKGQAFLSGSFQTPQKVPESSTNTTLIGLGVIGVGFLLRRHRQQSPA